MKRQHQKLHIKKGLSKPEGEHREHGHHHGKKKKRLDQQRLVFQEGERMSRQLWYHRHKNRPKEELPPGWEKIGEDKEQRSRQGHGRKGRHRRQMQSQSQSTPPPPQANEPDLNKRRRHHHWRFAKLDFQSLHPFGFQHSLISKWSRMRPQHQPQAPIAAHKVGSSGEYFPNDAEDKVAFGANMLQDPHVSEDIRQNYSQKSDKCIPFAPQMGSIPDFADPLRNCSFLYQKDINQDELEEKVKLCIGFMFDLATQEYQEFRKFIHEKVINLVNNNTFTHASHQNPYILMNTSIKNSANLKAIMQAYFVKNQPQANEQERMKNLNQTIDSRQSQVALMDYHKIKGDFVDQQFQESLKKGQNIKYKNFERKLQSKVAWLAQQCSHLFQQQQSKSKEKDPSSVDLFTITVNHILYGNTVAHHIKELVFLARSNPEKTDHMIKQSFSDIAYKIFLVCSLKQCLKMSFKKERPTSKNLSFDSKKTRKAMYYSAIIASYADIPQFQEVSFDRRQQQVDLCAPSSLPFFDIDYQTETSDAVYPSIEMTQGNGIIQDNFYCHYFIELMNFLKSTITQGITIELTKNNLMVSNLRMKFAVQQPLHIVKTHKELESINPELSNVMKMIQQKQPQVQALNLFCKAQDRQKQISRHIEMHVNNLKFALRVLKLILLKLQYEESSQILEEFELNCDYQQDTTEKIRMVYGGLLQTFKSIKDPPQEKNKQDSISQVVVKESFQVDADQKDAFKLIEAIMIMKLTIITYKFYQLIDSKITYRKFLAINQQITSRRNPLSTIYTNLFSQNFYLQSITVDDTFLDQESPKTWEQEYNSNLMKLLDKLSRINKEMKDFSGIHGVIQFNQTQGGFCAQFTTDYIDHQKTVIFAGLPRQLTRELLIKVCMPVQSSKLLDKKKNMLSKYQEGKEPLQEEQRRQFTSIQAQQLIKTMLKRVKIAFDNATQYDIRVPLFLPRHFMIDNKISKTNFPNPVPRLNILQAFMDTNIRTKLYNPNFTEEYYLNRAITKLTSKLTTKSHNQFIQAIFLLSLTTEKTELQYLKSVRSFIKDKMQKSSTVSPVNIAQFFSKMTLSSSKNQVFWYLQQMSGKSIKILLESNIKSLHNFFTQEGVNQPSNKEQTKEYMQLRRRRAQAFCNLSFTNQPVYLIRKEFQLQQVDSSNQHQIQARMIRELLLLQYKNMKYLHYVRDNPSSLIKNIIAILPFYSEGKMISYEVVIHTEDRLLQPKSRYPQYFGEDQNEKWIIQRKRDFYYSLLKEQRKAFIDNLLRIIKQARDAKINLFNVDIATITIVPNQRLSPQGEQYFITYQRQKCKFTPFVSERILVRPIFDEISVCRVYNPLLVIQNNRVYQSYQVFQLSYRNFTDLLSFNHHLNVFTTPSYFQRAKQHLTQQYDENAEDIGNIGLIICSLIFNQHNSESDKKVKQRNFLINYKELIDLLNPYYIDNQHDELTETRYLTLPDLVMELEQLISRQLRDIEALIDNDQQFQSFLLKLIHPQFERRATVVQVQEYLRRGQLRP